MRLGYLARHTSCVRSPALKNLDVVAHTCNHRVWEARGSGVQGQTQLHNKWEASLRYMRSYLKKGGEGNGGGESPAIAVPMCHLSI